MERSGKQLTDRERDILRCLASGLANKEIAVRLRISEHTVKTHLKAIFLKLEVSSRAGTVAAWLESSGPAAN